MADHRRAANPVAESDRITNWDKRDDQDHSGFFVHPDECLFCGQCQRLAAMHFEYSEENSEGETPYLKRHVFSKVIRQPQSGPELIAVIDAVDNCMCDCIYYGGNDPEVEKALSDSKVNPAVFVKRAANAGG